MGTRRIIILTAAGTFGSLGHEQGTNPGRSGAWVHLPLSITLMRWVLLGAPCTAEKSWWKVTCPPVAGGATLLPTTLNLWKQTSAGHKNPTSVLQASKIKTQYDKFNREEVLTLKDNVANKKIQNSLHFWTGRESEINLSEHFLINN